MRLEDVEEVRFAPVVHRLADLVELDDAAGSGGRLDTHDVEVVERDIGGGGGALGPCHVLVEMRLVEQGTSVENRLIHGDAFAVSGCEEG